MEAIMESMKKRLVTFIGRQNLMEKVTVEDNNSDKNVYLRPLLCNASDLSNTDILLSGINPATTISESDFDTFIKEQSELCKVGVSKSDNETRFKKMLFEKDGAFHCLYDWKRLEQKKQKPHSRKKSRTRTIIEKYIAYLEEISERKVLEADVIALPTSDSKKLREIMKAHNDLKKRMLEMYFGIIAIVKPKIIILYGKDAVDYFKEGLKSHIEGTPIKILCGENRIDEKTRVSDCEKASSIFTLEIKSVECKVFIRPHFAARNKESPSPQLIKNLEKELKELRPKK